MTGPIALIAIALANITLWVIARPAGQPTGRFLGELCGAEAVLLFSCSLVLATVVAPIERAFSGLDRVAQWHRRAATFAVALLVPHLALVTSPPLPYQTKVGHALGDVALIGLGLLSLWALAPSLRTVPWPGFVRWLGRISYERWLSAHRLSGLFVAVAVVHGAAVDPALRHSTVLRSSYLFIGGAGIVAYLYRELLSRFVIPRHDYVVAGLRTFDDATVDIALEPVKAALDFKAGQFVLLAFGGPSGWQRHPFTVASAPSSRQLKVSIRAAGDFTRALHDQLRPGIPAKVVGPFGGFDYRKGGKDQIWIAGGIGITPFLSWLRDLGASFDRNVDFYYSVKQPGQDLFIDEIKTIVTTHPTLRLHVVVTDRDGLLTAQDVMRHRGDLPWVYMCGPPPMMKELSAGFRTTGIASSHIRWEKFDVRSTR